MSIFSNNININNNTNSSLLIASDKGKIITEARAEYYTAGDDMWNGWVISGKNSLVVSDNMIYFPTATYATYELPAKNRSITIYLLARQKERVQDWLAYFSTYYANSDGNIVMIYSYNNGIVASHGLADDTLMSGFNAIEWHLLVMSINTSSKKVRYFVDGTYQAQKTFSNIGPTVFLTCLKSDSENMPAYVKYAALIDGAESDAVITSNCQNIMNCLMK